MNETAADTMLTAFFNLNAGEGVEVEHRDLARQTLYHDIPLHFTWDSSRKRWRPRPNRVPERPSYNYNTGKKPVVGRINTCSPKNLEKYALCMLLLNIKGPESFDDLLKNDSDPQNPTLYGSFQEAAIKKGLLKDEEEWSHCLDENAVDQMPSAMTQLFATILLNCDVPDPKALWERHKTQLVSLDCSLTLEERLYIAYMEVEKHIQNDNPNNSLAETFNIPLPELSTPPSSPPSQEAPDFDNEVSNQCRERAESMIQNLNAMQTHAYHSIIDSVQNRKGLQFFVDGPGGTGKSFVYKTVINYLRGQHKTVCVVASTGIAATLIGGVTAHKRFGMPLDLDADTVSCISAQSQEAKTLCQSDLIIWDEATASHKYAVDLLDRLLQDLMKSKAPFGGKTVVLGGDFRQCLPIVTRGTESQQIAACIKTGKQWPLFSRNTFHLTENMRANDPSWAQWLLEVGNGLAKNPVEFDTSKITVVNSPDALVSATFSNCINENNIESLKKTVILSATNRAVLELNEKVLNCVQSPAHMKYSIDSTEGDDEASCTIPPEFLHMLTPPGMPPHALTMKVNGIYMLLRNMNVEAGQCNGSRFIVRNILPHSLHCELIQDDPTLPVSSFILPRITSTPPKHYPFQFSRRQFPIRPAFAMTINKSQGGTFQRIGLDLTSPVFSHGQLYVALSRVPNPAAITVLTLNGETYTKNVVFPGIFDKGYLNTARRARAPRPNHSSRTLTDEDRFATRSAPIYEEHEDWSLNPPGSADLRDSFCPSTGCDDSGFIDPTDTIDPYSGMHVAPEDRLIFDD